MEPTALAELSQQSGREAKPALAVAGPWLMAPACTEVWPPGVPVASACFSGPQRPSQGGLGCRHPLQAWLLSWMTSSQPHFGAILEGAWPLLCQLASLPLSPSPSRGVRSSSWSLCKALGDTVVSWHHCTSHLHNKYCVSVSWDSPRQAQSLVSFVPSPAQAGRGPGSNASPQAASRVRLAVWATMERLSGVWDPGGCAESE